MTPNEKLQALSEALSYRVLVYLPADDAKKIQEILAQPITETFDLNRLNREYSDGYDTAESKFILEIKDLQRKRDEERADVALLEQQNIELNDASVALEKELSESQIVIERLSDIIFYAHQGLVCGHCEHGSGGAQGCRECILDIRAKLAEGILNDG